MSFNRQRNEKIFRGHMKKREERKRLKASTWKCPKCRERISKQESVCKCGFNRHQLEETAEASTEDPTKK